LLFFFREEESHAQWNSDRIHRHTHWDHALMIFISPHTNTHWVHASMIFF
jgi:hypothetical protein